jgi:Mn2+/Fe2+ NRAMP family transporter
MPWMIFYQQGAVIDKKLSSATIWQARQDTAFGSVLTQLIMIAVVIAVAAAVGLHNPGAALNTVGQISGALSHTSGTPAASSCSGSGSACWAPRWPPRSSPR